MPFSHCQNCLRALHDPLSQRNGFGPECKERIRQNQAYIDAGKRAVQSGACQDSKLITLGRILKRHEANLMRYSEDELIPEVIVRSLQHIRRDFTQRVRFLAGIGLISVPEMEYQLSESVAA